MLTAGDTYTAGDTGGEATHTLTVEEMPSHTHTYSIATTTGNDAGGDGVQYYRTHSTATSGSTGGGQAHNNMPPYLVVYAWRRVS